MKEDHIRSASSDAERRGSYLVFCLRSGNAVTDFASEREAWVALCDWARDDGLDSIEDLALSRMENGEITLIAMEDDLVQRVARELTPKMGVSESIR